MAAPTTGAAVQVLPSFRYEDRDRYGRRLAFIHNREHLQLLLDQGWQIRWPTTVRPLALSTRRELRRNDPGSDRTMLVGG